MTLMSELPAGDTHDVIRHSGQVVAVVVPIEEYQQLRQAMQEQQVNEEFDAARQVTRPAARPGRSATCRMRKRAAPGHAIPVSYQVNWELQALDQTAGFLRDDPIGVAALWDRVGQLADELRPPESFPYGSPDLRRLRAGRYRVFYRSTKNGG